MFYNQLTYILSLVILYGIALFPLLKQTQEKQK